MKPPQAHQRRALMPADKIYENGCDPLLYLTTFQSALKLLCKYKQENLCFLGPKGRYRQHRLQRALQA